MDITDAQTSPNEEKEKNSVSTTDDGSDSPPNQTSSLDLSPNTYTNDHHVWESNRPSNNAFSVWEDPPDSEPIDDPASTDSTASTYRPELDEDKENIYATGSDYDAGEAQQRQANSIDWSRLEASPRDVFGLPLNQDLSSSSSDQSRNPRPRPRESDLAPPGMQLMMVSTDDDDEDADSDHDFANSFTHTQRHDLFDLTASFHRGLESRERQGHRAALRHGTPVQAPLNFFTEVRRITETQHYRQDIPTPDDE